MTVALRQSNADAGRSSRPRRIDLMRLCRSPGLHACENRAPAAHRHVRKKSSTDQRCTSSPGTAETRSNPARRSGAATAGATGRPERTQGRGDVSESVDDDPPMQGRDPRTLRSTLLRANVDRSYLKRCGDLSRAGVQYVQNCRTPPLVTSSPSPSPAIGIPDASASEGGEGRLRAPRHREGPDATTLG